MTYDQYNAFCKKLPATTHVVQWGGAHVWKVGGKVFAIGGWEEAGEQRFTFKTSDIAFEILKERRGLRPAPYLASRGLKWIQHYARPGLSDRALKDYNDHPTVRELAEIESAPRRQIFQRKLSLLSPEAQAAC